METTSFNKTLTYAEYEELYNSDSINIMNEYIAAFPAEYVGDKIVSSRDEINDNGDGTYSYTIYITYE